MTGNERESNDESPPAAHGRAAPNLGGCERLLLVLPVGVREHPLWWWTLRYGMAVVAVPAALGLRTAITASVEPGLPTYITFYPAVMVAGLLGGLGPGLLATTLAGLATAYWVLPPEGLAVDSPVERVGLALFAGMGLFMSAVAELYRRSRRRTAAYEREIAVRQSETRYRSYIDVTGQLGWTTNADGEVVEDIPTWREFTGQTCEEIQGWGWAAALHPDDVDPTTAVWRKAVAEKQKYETEYRVRRHDGVYRHFLARGVPIFHDDGSVREWVGTCIDITKRQQAEEAMRQAKEDWERTFNTVPDFVALVDTEHRIVRANRAMAGQLGLAPEQCVGVHCYRAVHDEEGPPEYCPYEHTCRDGREYTAEVCEARLGGHFLVTTTPRFDEQGRVVGAVHVARDITHLKRAEKALRENQEDLNHAQAVAHIGSWRLDVRRDELSWSDETHRIFGMPKGAPLSYETFLAAIHPEDRQLVDDRWQAALRGETYDVEHRIVVGGEVKWVREKAELEVDKEGSLRGGFGTVQDITDRKRMEEALVEAKAAAEAAAEAKGQFLANVSHELRTPMNAILGMVDLALPRQADPTAKEFLETARNSADLLLALLNDLLDSAKIEAGKLKLESAPFSLRRVLNQTTEVLTVRASEKGICFACHIPPDVPDTLVGDQVRLRQVLLNLAGNAVKFTDRGEVVVRVEVEERGGEGERGRGEEAKMQRHGASQVSPSPPLPLSHSPTLSPVTLRFSVADTGIGIPPEEQDRIFHPFTQADPSTTRQFGGTGLGLSICSSLVAMMGGRVWLESQPGQGSVFYFTVRLPLAKELPPERETHGALAAAASKLRILLVEDNPANQKLAGYILRERGHTVEIAGNGEEGLRMALENDYDIILMDVQMPGMDGLEATAAIRKREEERRSLVLELGSSEPMSESQVPRPKTQDLLPARRVPIIAMTAHAMQGDRDRCLAGGMDGYLSKPINGAEMIALVESLAAGANAMRHSPAPAHPARARRPAVFDLQLALTRCYNDPGVLAEMVKCYFDEVVVLLPQMRSALEGNDLLALGRLAHRFKGTVVYIGAEPVSAAVTRVEQFERCGGTKAEAEQALGTLERECEALKAALAEHWVAVCPKDG